MIFMARKISLVMAQALFFRRHKPDQAIHPSGKRWHHRGPKLIQDGFGNPTSDTNPVSNLVTVGNEVYFVASAERGKEWWRLQADGTITELAEIVPGEDGVVDFVAKVFPETYGGDSAAAFLVGVDAEGRLSLFGSRGGDPELLAIPQTGPGNAWIRDIEQVQGGVIFHAWDPAEGSRIWYSDGSEQGTVPVYDVKPGIVENESLITRARSCANR